MTIDADELERLREIAENATPGPWRVSPWHVEEDDETVRCAAGHAITSTPSSSDCAHIAAFDPPTSLSLIAELKKAREEIADAMLAERERAADIAEHLGDNEIAAAIRRAE